MFLPRQQVPLPAGLRPSHDGLRMELATLRAVPPGPELAGRLIDLGAALTDPASQLRLLGLWERYASWVSAQQQAVLAAVAGAEPEPAPDGSSSDDWVREEVGCALRLSPAAAHRRIELARRLSGALRPARDALARGELTFLHALTLGEQVRDLSDPAARAVTTQVLPGAGGASLGTFRKAIARAVAAADPTALETAQLRSRRERRVERWRGADGAAVLAATGPAVDAELIYAALTAASRATRIANEADRTASRASTSSNSPGDQDGSAEKPSLDALRYDTLLGWARAALTATGPGNSPPRPDTAATSGSDAGTRPAGPTLDIHIVIDLPTLLGLAEHPAELSGYGPIPPALARELAADGRWRRLVTDPVTGHLLDYGRRSYHPPAALADYITARDRTCRFPHCTRPAARCDQDHQQPWDFGGTTSATNLHSLCRRHHRLKTFTRWRYQPQPDGSLAWTSPSNHSTTIGPPAYAAHPDTG